MIGSVWTSYYLCSFEGLHRSCLQREGIKACSSRRNRMHTHKKAQGFEGTGEFRGAQDRKYWGVSGVA